MHIAGILCCAGMILALVCFQVLDYDVWWHIKAGQMMRESWSIPATDPFAYTREGQPYLATHGWLAEILLSLLYDRAGANGLIILRMFIVFGICGLILSVDRARIWPNVLLAVPAVAAAKPAFMDRPQLFTFLLFAAFLRLAIAYLDTDARQRGRILLALVAGQVLWVNLHGAACILGMIIAGSLGLQRLSDTVRASHLRDPRDRREIALLLLTGVALVAGLCASPNGWHNLFYIHQLLTDNTIQFIQEWQPRPWGPYLRATGLWWLLGIGMLIRVRRAPVFSVLIIGLFGWLSMQAFRHEALFVFAAFSIVIFQLRSDGGWHMFTQRLSARPVTGFFSGVVVLIMLGLFVRSSILSFTQRHQTFGFGAFTPASGAVDFLEREHLDGRLFNSYDIGGYLLFRGAPQRKIFIDGRNVDFGFTLLDRVGRASNDPDVWRALEEEYGFTVAVIHVEPYTDINPIPYTGHLGSNPGWALVYTDDWTAVYLKDVPAQRDAIERLRYRLVTPERLAHQQLPEHLSLEDASALERELTRAAADNLRSIDALLLLAQMYRRAGFTQEASLAVSAALSRRPGSYRPYEARALIAMEMKDWQAAAEAFSSMLGKAGPIAQTIRYDIVADVFEHANRPLQAWWYRRKTSIQ